MKVIKLDGDPPGLRDMLIRADHPRLAEDLCDRRSRTWPLYVAVTEEVVGLLEGRFDFEHEERHAQIGYSSPWAFVLNIVVDPDLRRRAVGSALMKRFVADAAEGGRTYVALEVNLQDRSGLGRRTDFFRSGGFVPLSTINGLPEVMGAPIAVVNETLRSRSRRGGAGDDQRVGG